MLIDSIDALKQSFDAELQDPKTTFWSVLQTHDVEILRKFGIIDEVHFALMQELKQRAEAFKDICFPHKNRHVLTLFANQPEAFKTLLALDAEYKAKVVKNLPSANPIFFDLTSIAIPQEPLPGYVNAKIKRIAWSAFAILAVGAASFLACTIGVNVAVLPATLALACLRLAYKVIDYSNGEAQTAIRASDSRFVDLVREHGIVNLLQVFRSDELQAKFDAEANDRKTTFWNLIRRYNLRELYQAGIISSRHYALLTDLRKRSEPLNLTVYPGKKNAHHALTAFASEPDAFRKAEALDRAYKAEISRTSSTADA